jgi:uncharacterized protein (TIGR02246 family)
MKYLLDKLRAGLFAALLLGPAAATAVASEPAASQAEQAVRAAESQRFEALVRQDVPALKRLLADDLTYTHSSGLRQTRDEYLQDIASGKMVYRAIEPGVQRVQVMGATAIITGAAKMLVNTGGADRALELLYTDVHVKRDGRWQLLAWQSTIKPK